MKETSNNTINKKVKKDLQLIDTIEVFTKGVPFNFNICQIESNKFYATSSSFPLRIVKAKLPLTQKSDIEIYEEPLYNKNMNGMVACGSFFRNGKLVWQSLGDIGFVITKHPYNLPDTLAFQMQYDNILWYNINYDPNGDGNKNDTLYVYDLMQNKIIHKFFGMVSTTNDSAIVKINFNGKETYLDKRVFLEVEQFKETTRKDKSAPIIYVDNATFFIKNLKEIIYLRKISNQIIGVGEDSTGNKVLFWHSLQ